MNLTDGEKRDIVEMIQEGEPLPDDYRFKLFGDKREVELVWNGKTNEVTNVVLPFQTIEHVDEPRKESDSKVQGSLFDLDDRGRQLKGWTNKLIWGDNKLILSSLKNGPLREEIEKQGGIKLIYIDPPFDVGADFSMDIEIGDETITKQPSVIEKLAYRDTWGNGADSFIAMIYERLQLMHDLLADNGSIYVHCDWRVSSYIRLILDDVFGNDNFKNEIIWQGAIGDTSSKNTKFIKSHDTIYYYSKKNSLSIWNDVYQDYSETSKKIYKYEDEKGRYRLAPVDNPGGGGYRYSLDMGESMPKNGYRMPKETALKWLEKGILNVEEGKVPSKKLYMGPGVRCRDVWTDISSLQGNESIGYATQKPEALISRIIKASSNEEDLVCDFFMGSGTLPAVAEKMNRKWIGSDLGKFSIHTTRKRMIDVQRQLKSKEETYRAFELLNLGKYEREYYVGVNTRLSDEEQQKQFTKKEEEFTELILKAYKAEKVDGFKTFRGKKAARMIAIGPINLPVSRRYVEEVIEEALEKKITKVDIVAFEFEMGLFPAMQEEAKEKGVDLALKYIPPDVFDKRAIEKDEVTFYDVAYIEVKPHYKDKSVAIELTDFAVFYNQDAEEQVEKDLRAGSSKVVVRNGQVIQISKDRETDLISQEILTKEWTDWIDYWSVDFDFESKKEVIKVQNDDGEVEEKWTGDYIFENEWQSFRTKKDRSIELKTPLHEYPEKRRYKVAVKVVDIFGNDTMKVVEVNL